MNDEKVPVERESETVKHRTWRGINVNLKDFDDPRLEWRRLFGEAFGTFFLVLVASGAGVVNTVSFGAIGRVAAVVILIDAAQRDG